MTGCCKISSALLLLLAFGCGESPQTREELSSPRVRQAYTLMNLEVEGAACSGMNCNDPARPWGALMDSAGDQACWSDVDLSGASAVGLRYSNGESQDRVLVTFDGADVGQIELPTCIENGAWEGACDTAFGSIADPESPPGTLCIVGAPESSGFVAAVDRVSLSGSESPPSEPSPPESTPTCDDGVQNQGEADIDCGTPCPPCSTSSGSTLEIEDGTRLGGLSRSWGMIYDSAGDSTCWSGVSLDGVSAFEVYYSNGEGVADSVSLTFDGVSLASVSLPLCTSGGAWEGNCGTVTGALPTQIGSGTLCLVSDPGATGWVGAINSVTLVGGADSPPDPPETDPPPPPVAVSPEWPFERPSSSALQALGKRVLAHWHWFPMSFDNKNGASDYYTNAFLNPNGEGNKHVAYGGYLRERPLARLPRSDSDWAVKDAVFDAQLAHDIGIDGFLLNVWENSSLVSRWMAVFDGAAAVPGFGVAPNFDLSILGNHSDSAALDFMVDFIGSVQSKPALYRMDDQRVVVGMYHAGLRTPAFYSALKERLSQELGIGIYLVPVFPGTGSSELFESYAGTSDLLAGWGTAIPMGIDRVSTLVTSAGSVGRPWMQPLLVQDFRPYAKAYWGANNSRTLRSGWASTIASDVDWVQLVTWNDHAEHHALRPSTGKQWSFYDLSAYYIAWFKTGQAPTIVRDALYYFHRVHALGVNPTAQSELASCFANCPGTDEIEVVSFLTEPGTIEIRAGGTVHTQSAPAGVSSFTVPLSVGRPAFRLLRGGAIVVDFESAFEVQSNVGVQDLLYRGGGSLRAQLGASTSCTALCAGGDAAACLSCASEPVWLASQAQ